MGSEYVLVKFLASSAMIIGLLLLAFGILILSNFVYRQILSKRKEAKSRKFEKIINEELQGVKELVEEVKTLVLITTSRIPTEELADKEMKDAYTLFKEMDDFLEDIDTASEKGYIELMFFKAFISSTVSELREEEFKTSGRDLN